MMKYKVGDKVRVRKDLKCGEWYKNKSKSRMSLVTKGMSRFIGKEVTIVAISPYGDYRIKEDDEPREWAELLFEGLEEEASPEQPVKLYTWQDLCDYEILLYERWRIANEQRNEQGKELSVIHTLRQEYMKDIKMIMNRLGREVPVNKAKELGFEV